jgi:hypothetical protein
VGVPDSVLQPVCAAEDRREAGLVAAPHVYPVVNIIVSILMAVGVANNFGKGGGFAAGLIFLPIIFYPILAFGDSAYVGAHD